MNQEASTAWHQTLQDDPMLVAGDDDFTNLFQLGIDFPGFDDTQATHNGFDTSMGDLGLDQLAMDSSVEEVRSHGLPSAAIYSDRGQDGLIHAYSKVHAGAEMALNAPAIQHQQGQQQRTRDVQQMPCESRIVVPPTPQSNEMRGAAARYYHYMEGDGMSDFDPYQRHRNDQVSAKALQAVLSADESR
jgi:hypothetical protein